MAKFSKKHYTVVAKILRRAFKDIEAESPCIGVVNTAIDVITNHFSTSFREDNKEFDTAKFVEEVGE